MQVYLPIAEMPVDAILVLILGAVVGFLSGLFGVGGGFLMTPLLIFMGVPASVAVGTQANQLLAASVSGVLGHWRKRNVDIRLGGVMLCGSILGTALGVWLFGLLQRVGQIDLVISLAYVGLLGSIGFLMLVESLQALWRQRRRGSISGGKSGLVVRSSWRQRLPLPMRFPVSRLTISALLPAGIGFVGGLMVAILGVGGGFLLVPAMIYLLRMPTALVAGTSLFQVMFTTAFATVLQAATNHTVDVMLAVLLIVGGVVGAQFGSRMAGRLKSEQARALLAVIVTAVAVKLGIDLVATPQELYSLITLPPEPGLGGP